MILVTGAMGRTGTAVLNALHQAGQPARALVPSRRQVPWLDDLDAVLVEGECEDDAVVDRALADVHAVVLIARPGAEALAWQRTLIDTCVSRGIRRLVKLSVAGAAEDAEAEAARAHWRVEMHLRRVASEPVVVRCGRTMQDLLHQTPLVLAHHMMVGCQGAGYTADPDVRDVGDVLAAAATAKAPPDESLLVTGPARRSATEAATEVGAALGWPLRYVACRPDDLRQLLVTAGLSDWEADDLVAFEKAAAMGAHDSVTRVVEKFTGRAPRSFTSFAHETAASLRIARLGSTRAPSSPVA